MSKKLILFPFGGNSREALMSVLAVNALKKTWETIGFIDDDPATHGRYCLGVKVLGGRDILKKYPKAKVLALPGSPNNFMRRREVISSLGIDKERFATVVDPAAVVSPDATVGYNTLLMPNVFVSCGATVGNHCLVLPNTVISHDSVIGDHCCIGSNVSVSGGVVIGPLCYIGSGVRIKERITVKEGALIGLGAAVVSDIEKGVVAVGNPARLLRKVGR